MFLCSSYPRHRHKMIEREMTETEIDIEMMERERERTYKEGCHQHSITDAHISLLMIMSPFLALFC